MPAAMGFVPSSLPASARHLQQAFLPKSAKDSRSLPSKTSLHMFMGSDGGILGIGGPELVRRAKRACRGVMVLRASQFFGSVLTFALFVIARRQQFTILLVGYFVLGPSDLYKVVKSIGSFVQNARTLTTDLTKTFETNMESQLQLEEIRKAQRELNNAFSFRRSINVDQAEDAFSTTVTTPREGWVEGQDPSEEIAEADELPGAVLEADEGAASAAANAAAATTAPKKKKLKRRRRVPLQQPVDDDSGDSNSENVYGVPDLEMPEIASSSLTEEEQAIIDEEFERYTTVSLGGDDDATAGDVNASQENEAEVDEAAKAAEALSAQQRFQQQLSGNWNDQVLASEDVLTAVLRKLSLLEEEKAAATKRLEEEFERRSQLEETYYSRQREVLESALKQVEKQVVGAEATTPNNRKP
jgi:Sec-independent protein translocase protein TatA